MLDKLPPAVLHPLVALCSTLWLHAGVPLLPIGALIALAAKDVRRLGRRRFIPIALGAALGFAGQGLFVGAPSWDPEGISAGWRVAVELPGVGVDDGRVVFDTRVRTEGLPPEAADAFTEGDIEPAAAEERALVVDADDWQVSGRGEAYHQAVTHADGSRSIVAGLHGPHIVNSVVRIHADAPSAEAAYGWMEQALWLDVRWPAPPGAPPGVIGGVDLGFDRAGRETHDGAVFNVVGAMGPDGRPAVHGVLYRRGRVVIYAAATRADLTSAEDVVDRLSPALERVAATAERVRIEPRSAGRAPAGQGLTGAASAIVTPPQ